MIQRSLGTTDKRTASVLAGKLRAELFDQWGALPVPQSSFGDLDPDAFAVDTAFDQMLARLEAERKLWPANDAGYAAALGQRRVELVRLTRRLNDGEMSQWEAMADRMIAAGKLVGVKGSGEYDAFVRKLAEITIDALDTFIRRNEGNLTAAPKSPVVMAVKAASAKKAKHGETLLELFDRWSAECLAKGEKRPDTVTQDRKIMVQFAEFVGTGRDVRTITPIEVAEYRNTLRDLPPKWSSNKTLRSLSMREAAVNARKLELANTAFTTINKHLSTISPLYTWLAEQPAWAGLINPCNGLHHKKVKGKNPRPPFSTAVLNTILKSPLFTGFLRDGKEHLPGNSMADDWRKWVPLVCMFTGARIGEIAQLRIGDVREDRGVWFVHITHDESAGLVTKSGKSRSAAVHVMLADIGFLAFRSRRLVEAVGDLDAPLFPEIEANKRGQISGKPSRWWRDYLRDIGVKKGRDGYGIHSFRHTMADRLRSEAELLDDQIEVVLGHNQKTTTSGYGELPQGTVTMFKGWMDSVRFDGVDFSHLV